MSERDERVVSEFHRLYYDKELHKQATYLGVECHKCPLDLWIFQEIIHETKPTLIVELGVNRGGTTLWLAHLCETIGFGRVLGVDMIPRLPRPTHPRIQYFNGLTQDPKMVEAVRKEADGQRVMVIHDADHHAAVVTQDLENYGPMVSRGQYLIVEDTNVNGHPALPQWGPGPWEAVEDFLRRHKEFQRDASREKFMLTYNPSGYLRRTK